MTAADVTQEGEPEPGPEEREQTHGELPAPGYPRPFGPYLLLAPLAHGGMGEVFLASSRGAAGAVRLVVIKTLRPDLAREAGYVNRFLDEARIVIQLQHANICQVFDVGKQDGAHYFAMEHIAGTNMRRLIDAVAQARKSLPPSIALFVMADVLEGLDAAHRHRHPLTGQALNVVHRDVSPHNVMVSFEGDVKLIDFGLAASDMKMEHTESQVVMGKIAYMSPEQARGEPVDASSDQFSAAIVLYELLAGERYYGDMNQREIWSTAGGRGYVPRRWDSLDADVAVVLRRALADVPAERFPSCGAFASALRVLLQQKYPFADRAMLRSFVRDAVSGELEASASMLRSLGALALRAMPADDASRPARTSRPPTPPRTAAAADAGTGSTRTWAVFQGGRPRAGWPLALAAACGGLALGAIGMVVAPRLLAPPVAPPVLAVQAPPAAPAVAAPRDAPARVEEPAAPSIAEAPVEIAPVEVAPVAPAPVEVAPVAPRVEPRVEGRRARVEKKPREKARPWLKWSPAKKAQVIAACDEKCAVAIKNIQRKGNVPEPYTIDMCVETCATR